MYCHGALKLQNWTQTDEVARVDIAGLDNGGRGCKSELRNILSLKREMTVN